MKYHVEFDLEFKKNPYPGRYIALEGIDGSGKTTQAQALRAHFEKQGKKVVTTREPRKEQGIVGRIIAEILHGQHKVPPLALQYLFTADRVMHYDEVIVPALKKGEIVLSDRCFFSAIPYGILDKMYSEDKKNYYFKDAQVLLVAQGILSMYNQFIAPDKTFYLKVRPSVGLSRVEKKVNETKEMYETKEELEKIVLGYDWLAKEFPQAITTIDAEKPFGEVTSDILSKITQ